MPARYLIRFDDICPSMNWTVWREVEAILHESGVKPLLAVVPDNVDPNLRVEPDADDFWERVQAWQDLGWSIGLHGFEHRYVTSSPGLLGRNRYSEFAGLGDREQTRKLQAALEIFHAHGVRADAWVAPAHSFDDTTVGVLKKLGLDCISDGYSLNPYTCRDGMLWVPQQIGRFYRMPAGTWTVCLHINGWKSKDIEQFRREIKAFRDSIVTLGDIRQHYQTRRRSWSDSLFFNCVRALRSAKSLHRAPGPVLTSEPRP
jgi:predicted deacetylase